MINNKGARATSFDFFRGTPRTAVRQEGDPIHSIDAHQHFWTRAGGTVQSGNMTFPALARQFSPADLVPELDRAGIDATVLVQAASGSTENDRLLRYARNDRVAGVVPWLPISDPNSAIEELDRISSCQKVCGVRAPVGKDPLHWLSSREIVALFSEIERRGLVWDVVPTTNDQMSAILKLAETLPNLGIVLDHLARPPVDVKGWQPWAMHLESIKSLENIALKLSVGVDVLAQWDQWVGEDLRPYIQWAAECLGAGRLMYASNWPVVLIKAHYRQAHSDLLSAVEKVFPDSHDQARIMGMTATHWYGLNLTATGSP